MTSHLLFVIAPAAALFIILFGPELLRANKSAHIRALDEFAFYVGISVGPLFAGALVVFLAVPSIPDAPNDYFSDYVAALMSFTSGGELFLLAAAFVSAILWYAVREYKGYRFPRKTAFILLSCLALLVSATFFGGSINYKNWDSQKIVIASLSFFVLVLFTYYSVLVITNRIDPGTYASSVADETLSLQQKIKTRRERERTSR